MKCYFTHTSISREQPPAPFISVAGTIASYYQLEEGYVSLQEWQVSPYNLLFVQGIIDQHLAFEIRHQGASEILAISMNGRCELSVFPDSVTLLPSDCFLFYHLPNFQAFIKMLTPNKIVSILFIQQQVVIDRPAALPPDKASPKLLPVSMVELIDRIVYASYGVKKHFHMQAIDNLLKEAHGAEENLVGKIHFNESDIEGLNAVKEWLDKNLDKSYSVATITELAVMPIKKLNSGFLNLFADTPYHYFRKKKLELAHTRITQTNTPIKQIARQTGYYTTSNFSVAFKNKFGYTPGSLRKKSR